MGTFIPNTKEEQLKMLNEIGYKDFDDLFKVIPDAAKVKGELNLPDGLSEIEVQRTLYSVRSSAEPARTTTMYHPPLTRLPTKKNLLRHIHHIRLRSARVSFSPFSSIRQ